MTISLKPGLNQRLSMSANSLGGPGPVAFNESDLYSNAYRRSEIKDYIRLRLGDGLVDVELDQEHYDLAINSALDKFRQRSSASVEESYAFLEVLPETQEYILPREIMAVRQIFRRGIGSVTGTTASHFEPFASGYLNTYMLVAGRVGGLVNYELYTQYQELAMRFFGGHINFNFNSVTKKLTLIRKFPSVSRIYQRLASITASGVMPGSIITLVTSKPWSIPAGATININNAVLAGYNGTYTAITSDPSTNTLTVIANQVLGGLTITDWNLYKIEVSSPYTDEPVETLMLQIYNYKPDVMLLNDNISGMWIKEYAYSFAKRILGEARSKFSQLAGPGGGTQMNGTALLAEAKEELDKLEDEVKRYVDGGFPLTFVIG